MINACLEAGILTLYCSNMKVYDYRSHKMQMYFRFREIIVSLSVLGIRAPLPYAGNAHGT